jgi:hypothetical protein
MSFPRNPNSYGDVVPILQAAREQGGGIYECNTIAGATTWKAKAYFYRKLLIDLATARAGNPAGFIPSTMWDDLYLTRVGTCIKIEFRAPLGLFTTLEGVPVEVARSLPLDGTSALLQAPASLTPSVAEDELEKEAQDLLKKLG